MKVAVAGPIGSHGGLQTHYGELKSFLQRAGHEILAIDQHYAAPENIAKRYMRAAKILHVAKGLRDLVAFEPELFIAVSNGFGYALMALFAPRSCFRVRIEVTEDWPKNEITREIMARTFDAVAVQSKALLKSQEEKISARQKLGVLPCFTSIEYSQGDKVSVPEKGELLRLAYFGRLAKNKGLLELMLAVSKVASDRRFTLDIWGAGPLDVSLSNAISEYNLASAVTLKGPFPQGAILSKLMASYHGMVLASQYSEGLPLVLLEGASVGLPFLTTEVGAIGDCVIDNPDATMIGTGQTALTVGLEAWTHLLQSQRFSPQRLKNWYLMRHSREIHETAWKKMLLNPKGFFV